jgi:hypothetical protein
MNEVRIFIPNDINFLVDKKEYFLLVRPFLSSRGWIKKGEMFDEWDLDEKKMVLVKDIKYATLLLIPYTINFFFENKMEKFLSNYNDLCNQYGILGYAYISGDHPTKYKEFDKLVYFRMGGFRSKLSSKNIGFPAALTDQYPKIFGTNKILTNDKKARPVVGFCGLATDKRSVILKQRLKYLLDFILGIKSKPYIKGFQPIFLSSIERYKILMQFEKSKFIETNFIFRDKYRAGAKNSKQLENTTKEYYSNIRESDYVFCLRGYGNFSIRLYETLMMGRIPILLNTDCILPFPDLIDWKEHLIIVEWHERNSISEIVNNFHSSITDQNFKDVQINNRLLWLEKLKPKWILENLI